MRKKVILIFVISVVAFLCWFFFVYVKRMNSEVISAFEIMNKKLEESNAVTQTKLDSLYLDIESNNIEYSNKVKILNTVSDEYTTYIDSLKQHLVSEIETPIDDYSKMDDSSIVDNLFFNANGYTEVGHEFVSRKGKYKIEIENLFQEDFPEITKSINSRFNDRKDIDDWLEYNFKGFPLVAVLTKLTQMQADIKEIKKNILLEILSSSNS